MCVRVLEDGEHEKPTHFRVVDAGAYEQAIEKIEALKRDKARLAPETPIVENVAEDTYWAIAEVLKTECGWSVLEHVQWTRELLEEASEVLHDIPDDSVRILCAKLRACLAGEAPNDRWPGAQKDGDRQGGAGE
jgi:hypothetical protein